VSYPLDRLLQEVAFVTYHFHWSREEVLELTHAERHAWVREINRIHERVKGNAR